VDSPFPNHQPTRPQISVALLNRRDTYLSEPQWSTTPWELHPKSLLDRLFDITVLMPSIFARADRIIPLQATVTRRLRAQDLLANCLNIERALDEWHALASQPTEEYPLVYWTEEPDSPDASQIPFADSFAFRDGISSIMFLYYWMSLILFHRCVESLHRAIFQPVIDTFPDMYPDLPLSLQIDLAKYQQLRELASRVCRSLDFALDITVQPDMLVAPLTVVHEFYKEINASSRDGELEIVWCENFRSRLISKGQSIAEVIQGRMWADLGKF
jgi:hypothetical protein